MRFLISVISWLALSTWIASNLTPPDSGFLSDSEWLKNGRVLNVISYIIGVVPIIIWNRCTRDESLLEFVAVPIVLVGIGLLAWLGYALIFVFLMVFFAPPVLLITGIFAESWGCLAWLLMIASVILWWGCLSGIGLLVEKAIENHKNALDKKARVC